MVMRDQPVVSLARNNLLSPSSSAVLVVYMIGKRPDRPFELLAEGLVVEKDIRVVIPFVESVLHLLDRLYYILQLVIPDQDYECGIDSCRPERRA